MLSLTRNSFALIMLILKITNEASAPYIRHFRCVILITLGATVGRLQMEIEEFSQNPRFIYLVISLTECFCSFCFESGAEEEVVSLSFPQ